MNNGNLAHGPEALYLLWSLYIKTYNLRFAKFALRKHLCILHFSETAYPGKRTALVGKFVKLNDACLCTLWIVQHQPPISVSVINR